MGLLPWAVLAFGTTLLAAGAAAGVALAPFRASAAATTWVERARLAFPARVVSRFALVLLPLAFAVFAALAPPEVPVWWPSAVPTPVVVAVPALVAAAVVRLHVERVLRGRRVGAGEMVAGWVALWAVMFPHAAVAIAGLAVVADAFDARTWLALSATTLAVLGAFAGVGVHVARGLGVVHPASERLRRAVAAASDATKVVPRRLYEVDLLMANAFALPAARAMLFTREALSALDDAQIAAVARHELGHVSEPPRTIAARAGCAILMVVGLVAARPIAGALTPPDQPLLRAVFAVLVIFNAVVISRFVLRPLAHRLEVRADAIARTHDAHDGEYAGALEAIYAANLMPAVTHARGAHPHLYDRLVAAGAPPPWPRPAPPSRPRLRAALAVCMGITAVAVALALSLSDTSLF